MVIYLYMMILKTVLYFCKRTALSKHLCRKAWAKFARAHIHRRQSWRM